MSNWSRKTWCILVQECQKLLLEEGVGGSCIPRNLKTILTITLMFKYWILHWWRWNTLCTSAWGWLLGGASIIRPGCSQFAGDQEGSLSPSSRSLGEAVPDWCLRGKWWWKKISSCVMVCLDELPSSGRRLWSMKPVPVDFLGVERQLLKAVQTARQSQLRGRDPTARPHCCEWQLNLSIRVLHVHAPKLSLKA